MPRKNEIPSQIDAQDPITMAELQEFIESLPEDQQLFFRKLLRIFINEEVRRTLDEVFSETQNNEDKKKGILSNNFSRKQVQWFDNQFPPRPEDGITEYVIIMGKHHDIRDLSKADQKILHTLYPDGPTVIR